ncbi:urease accessory protein UreD [Tateyamaria omphalii]|uniref:urease accessory protein UreD n=1 Tax=Tateyamaria omphalii TaxID=299262 RepID=UPI00167341A5|nr:urease accessory protein UreD [Tateyamaria omphalii]GGX49877.1 urease accessory protein UreD [Tateyamaria omphalii]
MTAHLPLTPATPLVQPRAIGSVRLSTKPVAGQTLIDGLYQQGAAKAVFPRAARGMTAVLLNTSGGVTGGDRFDYAATAGASTHLTMTTQACERAYRAQPGEVGRVETRLTVKDNATLWWLPQETLIFDGCAMTRRLSCDLAPTARALIVEPMCLGRIAMGEDAVQGHFADRISIIRDGAPLVLDAWTLSGDMTAQMSRSAIGDQATAMVSLTYIAPDAEAHLPPIRALLPETGGASLLTDDTLVLRALAPSGYYLRKALLPILDHLTGGHLPICWRL